MRIALFFVLAALLNVSTAFYLPGVTPKTFQKGDIMHPKVTSLTSTESQLTFDYYSLPFCTPEKVEEYPENLGEALLGEKAFSSTYKFEVLSDTSCEVVCRKTLDAHEVQELQDFAVLSYRSNMRMDNLPMAQVSVDENDEPVYSLGSPIAHAHLAEEVANGENEDRYVLYNHLHFTILYHPADEVDEAKGVYIVGFQVQPESIQHVYHHEWDDACAPNNCELETCPGGVLQGEVPLELRQLKDDEHMEAVFSYGVTWKKSDVKWASRWDIYLEMKNDKIHWFNIVNSLIVVVFLTGTVALIMLRILKKDFAMYNDLGPEEEGDADAIREDSGWKLVYGDVFRAPVFPTVLSVLIGSGEQVFVMTFLTLLCAMLGFLSPSNRGSLVSAIVFFFVLMGAVAGYTSARYCKFFKESNQFKVTVLTATVFPSVIFAIFFIVDLFLWSNRSASAVPFGTMIALMVLWFFISVPLVFLGSYFGFKKDTFSVPVRTNAIPRKIGDIPWYLRTLPSITVSGILPFGVLFVEMSFILSSIWQHRFYYLFGFLFLVFVLCMITIAEVSLVLCYFQLCYEDYNWWWRSYFSGGSIAIYVLLYSIYQHMMHAHTTFLSGLIYFGYMIIISYSIFILSSFVSFTTCFYFVRTIYGAIKID